MKRLLLIVALTLSASSFTACHRPVTIQTPAGKTAYTADQIVLRVNELQNAAIKAEAAQQITTAQARTIVQFCVSADQTLAATPAGWLATISSAWTETKQTLGTMTNPAIVAAMGAVDVVLAIEGGPR